MPRLELSPGDADVTAARPQLAGEGREQVVLALALERGDSEHLAGTQGERDTVHGADAEVDDLERGTVARARRRSLARMRRSLLLFELRRAGLRLRRLGPQHVLDDSLLAALLRLERPDGMTVAEHRRPIAACDHLGQAVRDEEHRPAVLTPVAHHGEHPLGEIGRQRRGDLVEQEQLRIAREGARQIEHAEHRQRHVSRLLRQVDVELHRPHPFADGIDRGMRQAEVLGHGQVRHERRVLEHGREADARRGRRGGDLHLRSADADRPAVLPDDTGQDLDERALAGPVRPQQGVHLARLDRERRRAQCDDRAVALRDVPCLQQAHASLPSTSTRKGRPRTPLSVLASSSTAPCRRRAAPWCTSSTA